MKFVSATTAVCSSWSLSLTCLWCRAQGLLPERISAAVTCNLICVLAIVLASTWLWIKAVIGQGNTAVVRAKP